MPRSLPKGISLCLFRILQEALQNAANYGGVRHFSLKLAGTPAEIQLTISDRCAGFDQQHAFTGRGLGLISMRERIPLVKGEISITSQPARGTTVLLASPSRRMSVVPAWLDEMRQGCSVRRLSFSSPGMNG
jgi:signal transduction histidine kinase